VSYPKDIVVRGAREHNLKGVDLRIPRGSLAVMTGVSGSGKSSLAFDTLYQEGRRRFVESLSSYARQFLGRTEKPKVDRLEGLSPAVSIDQKTTHKSPRSTVGTTTEIYDHLRLLYSRLGTPRCPDCGKPVSARTAEQIVDRVFETRAGRTIVALAPIVRDRKGEYRKELEELRLKGYVRARIDGEIRRLDEPISLARYERHTIEVVLDRVAIDAGKKGRLTEAIETGLKIGGGFVSIQDGDDHETYGTKYACPDCSTELPELEPRAFSFNSPHGACPACDGLGETADVDRGLIVPDPSLTIDEGAIAPMRGASWTLKHHLGKDVIRAVCDAHGIPRDVPWRTLTERRRSILLDGAEGEVDFERRIEGAKLRAVVKERRAWRGVAAILRETHARLKGKSTEAFFAPAPCRACGGSRLRRESAAVDFRGRRIGDLASATVADLRDFFDGLELSGREEAVGAPILKELKTRLRFLLDVGLGYLTLDRGTNSLSGGESQRIRLATQVGSGLRGVLYVLDEPSIGLHQRDNRRLVEALEKLRDAGNTVVVVEHDRETMEAADWIVDVGPGAGAEGGEVVVEGSFEDVLAAPRSITGAFLSGKDAVTPPKNRRVAGEKALVVKGARARNLKNVEARFPVGVFTCVTGVSGSGKSTLVDEILKRVLARRLHGAEDRPGEHDEVLGIEHFDKVIEIDQSPIGRTPRSNPATYVGVFDLIRDLFSNLPEAKARGYAKGRFSFNVKGGRCEACGGAGVKTVEMQFLADVETPCDLCEGLRFNPETLEIKWRGKSITDVLETSIADAREFFLSHPKIKRSLDVLCDVGLGYVKLGQPSTTLSGGEAQRVKLASQLQRPPTGRTLYLLDEPTTGLHFLDVKRLVAALARLVDAGNTVVVIEHNLDVVRCADWIVDLGPEGGAGGGEVVYSGPFDGVLTCERSVTGAMLVAEGRPRKKAEAAAPREVRDRGLDGDVVVRGAKLHNLRDVVARFPAGKMSVVTGPSGSGKTSLVFDTLFAEGRRRFVECLSTYARQFLGRLDRPPVDALEGLAPAVAIDQKNAGRNPRSTVATTTEIHDYLRLLYARLGAPHCPKCGAEGRGFSPNEVVKDALGRFEGEKARVLAPLWRKGFPKPLRLKKPAELLADVSELRDEGFARVMIDDEELRLDEIAAPTESGAVPAVPAALKTKIAKATEIALVIDRVAIAKTGRTRLLDSVAQAFAAGRGVMAIAPLKGEAARYGEHPHCVSCGWYLDEAPSPKMFSFNSHVGACAVCRGLGVEFRVDEDKLVARPELPLFEGALIDKPGDFLARGDGWFRGVAERLAKKLGCDLRKPFGKLPAKARKALLFGYDGKLDVSFSSSSATKESTWEMSVSWKGLAGYVEDWYRTTDNEEWREILATTLREDVCPSCDGERLKPEFRAFRFAGRTLAEIGRMTVDDASAFYEGAKLKPSERLVAEQPFKEVLSRLRFLSETGLGYLELGRSAGSLSGGESQRIRLATQIGNRLTGVIYVLDEPTIGLHQRDTERLLKTLRDLRDLGNTLVLVEHDRETIEAADWTLDLGPGAGRYGGAIVYEGSPEGLARSDTSTGRYLRGEDSVAVPTKRLRPEKKLVVEGATRNNLKGIDVAFPIGALTAVTGVSGSGKSSLVMDVLAPAVTAALSRKKKSLKAIGLKAVEGVEAFEQMIVVDQAPVGTTPKSNPASYLKIFDHVRKLFSETPTAKARGFGPGRFSFNTGDGRCGACDGRGRVKIEMHFLPDVWIECESCGGRRYDRATLAVEYQGKTIADVLDLEVGEAAEFFKNHRRIAEPLALLRDTGLGYLRLGQSATTLSGGESQRLKLAKELSKRSHGRTLYLLDEPTTGLHFDDVAKLAAVLRRLVDAGNTVIVIEHNLDVVRAADHVIDMGPEAGLHGGTVVVEGTPEDVAAHKASHTGRFLKRELRRERAKTAEAGA
jgi:excinuclease ABC subunit A